MIPADKSIRRPGGRNPLQVQWAVVHALFIRNLSAQFGRLRGGFVWAFIEPLLQVLLFTLLFTLRGKHELNNIPIPMLVLTGIAPFILFRQITTGAGKSINQSAALFNYRLVKPIDPVCATVLYHVVFFIFTLLAFGTVYYVIGIRIEQVLPLLLLTNILLLALISTGLGLLFSVLLAYMPEARKIVPFFVRPLFFISGIFFTADSIPSDYRDYLLLNPLLHVTEITRACFYYSYPSHGDIGYVAVCALAVSTAGLLAFRLNRRLFQEE